MIYCVRYATINIITIHSKIFWASSLLPVHEVNFANLADIICYSLCHNRTMGSYETVSYDLIPIVQTNKFATSHLWWSLCGWTASEPPGNITPLLTGQYIIYTVLMNLAIILRVSKLFVQLWFTSWNWLALDLENNVIVTNCAYKSHILVRVVTNWHMWDANYNMDTDSETRELIETGILENTLIFLYV